MKKTFYILSIAALVAAVFASCNKVEEEVAPVDEQPSVESLTFAISSPTDTKAILGESGGKFFGEWENNDKLGSITTKSYGSSTVDASSTPVTFKVYSSGGLSEGNTINLWYPYVTNQSDATAVPMSIPTSQYQVGGDFDFSAMPMVAEEITVTAGMVSATSQTPVDVVSFYNLGSLIQWQIYTGSSYTTEKIVSVTFNGNSALAGDFTKNVKAVDASDAETMTISGYTETSVTTYVAPFTSTVGTDADRLDVFMVIAPGSYSGNVVVVTNAATYTWPISSAQTFNRSGIRTFGLKLDKASATRVPHVKGSFSFWLNKASYDSAADDEVSWALPSVMTMTAAKGTAGTNTNNYLPPTNTSTRFYKNSILTFTPGSLQIEKVEYNATTDGYATAMNSSTWSNASHSVAGTVVTIVPTDGSAAFGASSVGATTGATEVKVYYDNNNYTITKATGLVGGSIAITGSLTQAKVNTTINLEATPESGYTFTSWTVTDDESNPVTVDGDSFQMPASNVTVSATFTASSSAKAIHITPPSNGTVVTDPDGSATAGATVTITATPNAEYGVSSISVIDEDSAPVAVTNNQFTMPDKEVTITVIFVKTYVLTCSSQSGNSAYATYYTVNQGGLSWSAPGNQTLGAYWQIGGLKKSKAADPANTDTRYICMIGENTLDFDVSTITVYTNGVNNTNLVINSITVTAHNSAADAQSGDNVVATFTTSATLTFAANTDKDLVYTKSGSTDCTGKYFRVAINATNNTTSNHGLKVKSIKLQ